MPEMGCGFSTGTYIPILAMVLGGIRGSCSAISRLYSRSRLSGFAHSRVGGTMSRLGNEGFLLGISGPCNYICTMGGLCVTGVRFICNEWTRKKVRASGRGTLRSTILTVGCTSAPIGINSFRNFSLDIAMGDGVVNNNVSTNLRNTASRAAGLVRDFTRGLGHLRTTLCGVSNEVREARSGLTGLELSRTRTRGVMTRPFPRRRRLSAGRRELGIMASRLGRTTVRTGGGTPGHRGAYCFRETGVGHSTTELNGGPGAPGSRAGNEDGGRKVRWTAVELFWMDVRPGG